MMDLLYLDDLAVGDEFISDTYRLSADKIKDFAEEYDPQNFHCDETMAEQSFFKGLAASGWQTGAITMKLIVESIPLAHGIIGAGADIKWLLPTRPDDVLHVKSTIREIKPSKSKPNQALITFECETINEQEKVCQRMFTQVLSFKKEQ